MSGYIILGLLCIAGIGGMVSIVQGVASVRLSRRLAERRQQQRDIGIFVSENLIRKLGKRTPLDKPLEEKILQLADIARHARAKEYTIESKSQLRKSGRDALRFLHARGRYASAVLIGRFLRENDALDDAATIAFSIGLSRMEKHEESIAFLEEKINGKSIQDKRLLFQAKVCLLELYIRSQRYAEAATLGEALDEPEAYNTTVVSALAEVYARMQSEGKLQKLLERTSKAKAKDLLHFLQRTKTLTLSDIEGLILARRMEERRTDR